jgi:hypothetical protein
MTDTASDEFEIQPALCELKNHPDAQSYLRYMLECQIQLVRSSRIWADAGRRCIESIDFVNQESIAKFVSRMKNEPFAYRIFTKILSTESDMLLCADCADLLDLFQKKFPN